MGNPPPPATVISRTNQGSPPTGTYRVTIEQESSLNRHTIYRPDLTGTAKIPIVSWGNGGCSANGLGSAEFLTELASHGYLVIANGPPNGSGSDPQDGSTHVSALNWAVGQNANPCSKYSNKLDVESVAFMGYSCGGLMSLNAAKDMRVSTVVAWNSGLINPDANVYASLHAPMAYFNGGPSDQAYPNGNRDYQQINNVPVYMGNLPVGHGGTYNQDNGGEYGRVGVAWLNWHLKGDQTARGRGMFLGQSCGICNTQWQIQYKNF